MKTTTRSAKGTHGNKPSSARVGAYAHSSGVYTDYKGEKPTIQSYPFDSGKPHRTSDMKRGGSKKNGS